MAVPAAYLAVVIIWSTTPLAIQWSSAGWGYLFGLSGRMLLGTLVCLILLTVFRIGLPWHRAARHTYVVAGVSIFLAMYCVYWGAQTIPSGLIAVFYGLNPLLTGIISAFWLGEKSFTPGRVLGLLLGIGGLWVIFSSDLMVEGDAWQGVLAILFSVMIHSAGGVAIKRLGANISGLSVTSGGLLIATPLFVMSWLLVDGDLPETVGIQAGVAMVYLGVFGSALGFSLYFYLLKNLEANRVALITLITPGLALLLGLFLNNETISSYIWLGSGLIILGLLLHLLGDRVLGRVIPVLGK